MRTRLLWAGRFLLGAFLAGLAILLVYQIPAVRYQAEWRLDRAAGIMRGWLYPSDTLPTPSGALNEAVVGPQYPSLAPAPSETPEGTSTPAPAPTPLPSRVILPPPPWEKQDWNNCGPATLALALRFYGWPGDQFDISRLLKPDRGDKNVNVEELVYYVRTHAGWLQADYRVGGSIAVLKGFIAAGYPMVIEKGFILEEGDSGGGWAGHYLLLTGYDDGQEAFLGQDTYKGPDQWVPYDVLEEGWRSFNRVYILIYPPDRQEEIDMLLGPDADPESNRQRALELSRQEVELDPQDAFAWFNLGTNLLYFERYDQAAQAYDKALSLGLPWRFTRFQFGPYIAYFNRSRFQDIIQLADATLNRTPKAEESLLWRGWARYRLGEVKAAIDDFRAALKVNPNYLDARYALDFLGVDH